MKLCLVPDPLSEDLLAGLQMCVGGARLTRRHGTPDPATSRCRGHLRACGLETGISPGKMVLFYFLVFYLLRFSLSLVF